MKTIVLSAGPKKVDSRVTPYFYAKELQFKAESAEI